MIVQFDYGISQPVLTSHPRPLNLQLLEGNLILVLTLLVDKMLGVIKL